VIGSSPDPTRGRRPVHSVIRGAREQHRSNAQNEAEDPADLGSRVGSYKQGDGTTKEYWQTNGVEPAP
jgi:hypothetical protein